MKPTRGMTPAKRVPGTPMRPRAFGTSSDTESEEVAVFCRLRPPNNVGNKENDNNSLEAVSCARTEGGNVVVLTPPETARAYRGGGKEFHYTFTRAFGEDATQKDVFDSVGMPLVRDLVAGRNALLFMYGVTGSGKTHTIQGTPEDGGLMVRAVDVIFNSISDRQVGQKRMIVPDGTNGFLVQTVAQAMVDRQQELINDRQRSRPNRAGANTSGESANMSGRLSDDSVVSGVDRNSAYAVFISYVEVYNEKIFDLLETDPRDIGRNKYLMADSYDCQYVHGCIEVQVESAREALETFHRGRKRRRVANTALNDESSRSHSIFNIRVVRVQPGPDDEIDQTKAMVVSQMSLVDMAGSERTSRTGNTGEKLKESNNINNSLTTLRMCIKQLRDNQKKGRRGYVSYRNSQITKMFGSFFEGNGTIRMMVCLNPRPADFDENVNVMEFAEAAQKIQIERVENVARELYTPGRLRGNEAYRDALRRAHENPPIPQTPTNPVYSPIFSLGPDWPNMEVKQFDDEDVLVNLAVYLEKRIATRNTLVEAHDGQVEQFRGRLVESEKDLILLRDEASKLKCGNDGERRRIKDLETRLVNAEAANTSLHKKITALADTKLTLEKELDDKELLLNQHKKDQKRVERKFQTKLSHQEAINTELTQRLRDEEDKKATQMYDRAKLRAVRNIVQEEGSKRLNKTISDPDVSSLEKQSTPWKKKLNSARSNPDMSPKPAPRRSVAISNPRHRRSRSTGTELWVDHQPERSVPLNTIMQPSNVRKKRSVSKLTDKHINDPKVAHYCITNQEQDTDGDLETQIFKGDIIPTACGGKQVIFNDVEILKQKSPEKSPPKLRRSKRSHEDVQASVGSRVAAFETKLGSAKKHRYV